MYEIGEVYTSSVSMYSQYGQWAPWMEQVAAYLISQFGLDKTFAGRVAIMLAYATAEGLAPRITSGFRDPSHQEALQKQWDAGNRAGLRVRPATDSKHSHKAFFGPAALAIDIPTSNDRRMAQIAAAIGLGAGASFHTPDPGHYYEVG